MQEILTITATLTLILTFNMLKCSLGSEDTPQCTQWRYPAPPTMACRVLAEILWDILICFYKPCQLLLRGKIPKLPANASIFLSPSTNPQWFPRTVSPCCITGKALYAKQIKESYLQLSALHLVLHSPGWATPNVSRRQWCISGLCRRKQRRVLIKKSH